jgi:hypothetical protein
MTVSTMIEKAKIRTLAPKSIALYHLESNQCLPCTDLWRPTDGKRPITPKEIAKDTSSAVEKDGELDNRK